MLTAKSNSDRYLYLSRIEKTPKNLRDLRKEFATHGTNMLHADYDRGYFHALESFMRKLERSGVSQETADEEKPREKK